MHMRLQATFDNRHLLVTLKMVQKFYIFDAATILLINQLKIMTLGVSVRMK